MCACTYVLKNKMIKGIIAHAMLKSFKEAGHMHEHGLGASKKEDIRFKAPECHYLTECPTDYGLVDINFLEFGS